MLLLACSDTPKNLLISSNAGLAKLIATASQHPLRSRKHQEVSIWTGTVVVQPESGGGRPRLRAGRAGRPGSGVQADPLVSATEEGSWVKATPRDSDELSTDILSIYTYGQGKLTHLPKNTIADLCIKDR